MDGVQTYNKLIIVCWFKSVTSDVTGDNNNNAPVNLIALKCRQLVDKIRTERHCFLLPVQYSKSQPWSQLIVKSIHSHLSVWRMLFVAPSSGGTRQQQQQQKRDAMTDYVAHDEKNYSEIYILCTYALPWSLLLWISSTQSRSVCNSCSASRSYTLLPLL